ncbi:MAG: B12-binding domain-containing protein [Microthrixaceae bacterium]
MSSEIVDLQTAADHLGVHYQTAYKWVRSGQLPAELIGNKYVVDVVAIQVFAERRMKPASPTVRKPRTGLGSLTHRFTEALLQGNEASARNLVNGLTSDGVTLTAIIEEIMCPALRHIGTAWHEGRIPIWREHRATGIIENILGEHRPHPRGRRRGTVVVAAIEGDFHSMPTEMAAVALREDNWHVHMLGANLPSSELVDFCKQESPDIAVITVTASELQQHAEKVAIHIESLGVRTIVGRSGATLTELQQLAKALPNSTRC